jgi:GrpB-like predicted nucleotidyltransferase (UPF0157 family)
MVSDIVTVVPHDPRWPGLAAQEADHVGSALGELVRRIDHVGSTAVADLPAKPVIDLQISVTDHSGLDAARPILAELGYSHIPIEGFEDYPFHRRRAESGQMFHVHLCVAGSHHERRHLAVRDYLRNDEAARQEYGRLKVALVERTNGDRQAYIDGKEDFVRRLENAALKSSPGDRWSNPCRHRESDPWADFYGW